MSRLMISDIGDKVKKFLTETINAEGIRIVAVEKVDGGGWVTEAEVAEINQYLASIKAEYRVFDKEHYVIWLNANLEVSSYKRGTIDEEVQ